jgi:ATP-dependent DNA helicase RecQ
LGLTDVDLGFAGRSEAGAPVHRAIAALSAGSALGVNFDRGRGELMDPAGAVVGRFANSYAPPKGMTCVAVRVAAIMSWTRAQSDPDYRSLCRCDSWEVVVPEFTFQPI